MSTDDAPKIKPIAIEKRKNLLYGSNKRRSVQAIIILSLAALLAGLFLAFIIKGLGNFTVSGSGQIMEYASVQPDIAPSRYFSDRSTEGRAVNHETPVLPRLL